MMSDVPYDPIDRTVYLNWKKEFQLGSGKSLNPDAMEKFVKQFLDFPLPEEE